MKFKKNIIKTISYIKDNYKQIIKYISLLIVLTIIILVFTNTKKIIIKQSVSCYLDNIISNNYNEANNYLNEYYDYYNIEHFNKENYDLFINKFEYKIKKITTKNNKASVEILVKHPDVIDILEKSVVASENYLYSGVYLYNIFYDEDKYKKNLLESDDLKYITDLVTLNLEKKEDKWKIKVDKKLITFTSYGF